MSAVRCKIMLCANKAVSMSEASKDIASDLEKNSEVGKRVLAVQEQYVKSMEDLLGELSDG